MTKKIWVKNLYVVLGGTVAIVLCFCGLLLIVYLITTYGKIVFSIAALAIISLYIKKIGKSFLTDDWWEHM